MQRIPDAGGRHPRPGTRDPSVGSRSRMTTPAPTAPLADTQRGGRLPMALVTWAFVGLVLLLALALVVVRLTQGSTPPPKGPPLAPAGVVGAVSNLSPGAFDAAGVASLAGPGPEVHSAQGLYQVGGRPAVVFVGAEFSPYSAAESWAVVAALARFGTWSDLGQTASPANEVFARSPGFSFAGSGYKSAYLALQAVESYTSALSATAPAGFASLEAPGPGVLSLLRRFDAQPGGPLLPFVDVGGRMVVMGSAVGFSPGLLEGMSMSQVAGALGDPNSPLGRAVLGAANVLVAEVCAVDGGRPAAVCASAGARAAADRYGLR